MHQLKKLILSLCVILPLSAVSFAAQNKLSLIGSNPSKNDYNKQTKLVINKLENDRLPRDYYNYIEANGIYSIEALLFESNKDVMNKIIKQYKIDFPGVKRDGPQSFMR